MKRIKIDILTTFMLSFLVTFLVIFIISYFVSRNFLLELLSSPTSTSAEVILHFHILWMQLLILFFVLFLISFFIAYRLAGKISSDIHSLKEYFIDISEHKNYESPLRIDSYFEVLEASVYAKNIVKRLYQKEQKSTKK